MKEKAVATFKTQFKEQILDEIKLSFNPVSLQYSISNTPKEQAAGNTRKQSDKEPPLIGKSTGKLTMDLIFDTTDTGMDVRETTKKVAAFMTPLGGGSLPTVIFIWGSVNFQGLAESYRETIDFFSEDGVPLRASINLTLVQQDRVFDKMSKDGGAKYDLAPNPQFDAIEVPGSAEQDARSLAAQSGDARAGRAIAAANGLESMRFTAGAAITVDASVTLGAPVAFATGGASFSAGADIGLGGGLGVSAGAGAGIGAGIGVSGGVGSGGGLGVSAGVGISAGVSGGAGAGISGGAGVGLGAGAGVSIGGGASAGVAATDGAFAGLRTSAEVQRNIKLDPARLLPSGQTSLVATDSGAKFSVGGKALVEGAASLSTDVGASASLQSRLKFDE